MKREALISAVEDVLRQGIAMLEGVSDEDYSLKEGSGSIGAHYRHVLDHFLCLLDGLKGGEINYDRRARTPELENSSAAALSATNRLIEAFGQLSGQSLAKRCSVVYSVGYFETGPQSVESIVAREVMFCVGHAIHHYAILKMLSASRGVGLPYTFGIAPSTLKHLQAQAGR